MPGSVFCRGIPEQPLLDDPFPDNPPFAYACLYLPSFDREFGFYLDGNELCWARAIGPCSMQMLSQFPVADFRSPGMKQAAVLLTCLHFPVLGNLLEGWDCVADTVTEEDPFAGRKRNMVLNFLQFREYRELSAAWVEAVVNPVLYSRLFVKRGRTALNPAVAAELRKRGMKRSLAELSPWTCTAST